jgi:hypothetical protein
MSENKIADALGLRPLGEVLDHDEIIQLPAERTDIHVPVLPSTVATDEVIADIETARTNIESLMLKGADSLDELISLAKQSQNPRAFEVVSTLMKTLLDANKDFVGMSEKKKFAKEDNSTQSGTTNVTNNNLILSTTDLLKMMKGGE